MVFLQRFTKKWWNDFKHGLDSTSSSTKKLSRLTMVLANFLNQILEKDLEGSGRRHVLSSGNRQYGRILGERVITTAKLEEAEDVINDLV
jgi:hypothetical protein